jgi:hypothetical protein
MSDNKSDKTRTVTRFPGIGELRNLARGRVIAPNDPDYDEARTVFYGDIDKRPAAIIRALDRSKCGTIIEALRASTGTIAVTQIRVLGGAQSRVSPRLLVPCGAKGSQLPYSG